MLFSPQITQITQLKSSPCSHKIKIPMTEIISLAIILIWVHSRELMHYIHCVSKTTSVNLKYPSEMIALRLHQRLSVTTYLNHSRKTCHPITYDQNSLCSIAMKWIFFTAATCVLSVCVSPTDILEGLTTLIRIMVNRSTVYYSKDFFLLGSIAKCMYVSA